MANYLSDRTGANIDSVLDLADSGNIGKNFGGSGFNFANANDINASGFGRSNVNTPTPSITPILAVGGDDFGFQLGGRASSLSFRSLEASSWQSWQEIYHKENVGSAVFDEILTGTEDTVSLGRTGSGPRVSSSRNDVASYNHFAFYNPNGIIGTVSTSGSATSYNTSSDPRLKEFKVLPVDVDIDAKFNKLYSCFRAFNWKSDPEGDLVWGFDAHSCIDAKLDMGSEGEGGRELALGEVYKTDPAIFEDQEQQVLYKSGENKGQPRFYADGEPVMETVSVEIKAEVEHKVSPAGVDQSKAVPILLAKIEQLERRLSALES